VVGVYRINDNITVSGTWVYGTGNAITLPRAEYPVIPHDDNFNLGPWGAYQVPAYGGKNQQRMEAYHRADIGVQFTKKMPKLERTWEVSLYNLYNRKNPYFYFLDQDYNPKTEEWVNVIKKISIFPIIPSVSLNLKF
ncbi:MAG: hypothetical protein R6V49_00765, partial [Bacteroidales bacterium]